MFEQSKRSICPSCETISKEVNYYNQDDLVYLRDVCFHLINSQIHYWLSSTHLFLNYNILNPHESLLYLLVALLSILQYSSLELDLQSAVIVIKKSSDDSSIVYRAGDEVHFSRIHWTFQLLVEMYYFKSLHLHFLLISFVKLQMNNFIKMRLKWI